jgi:hypothetical protein
MVFDTNPFERFGGSGSTTSLENRYNMARDVESVVLRDEESFNDIIWLRQCQQARERC